MTNPIINLGIPKNHLLLLHSLPKQSDILADLDKVLLLQLQLLGVGDAHGGADDVADLPAVEALVLALLVDPLRDVGPVGDELLLAELVEELDEDVAAVVFA